MNQAGRQGECFTFQEKPQSDPTFTITQHFEEENSVENELPKPPPRYKKKVKLREVAHLNLENISNDDHVHQNDILFRTDSTKKLLEEDDLVKGDDVLYYFLAGS